MTRKHLGAPRREVTDVVGKELLLYRCQSGTAAESVMLMDLPFLLFIPFGRGGEETGRRIPPASLQLPSRLAETYYELVVTVQQGQEQKKFAFPVPIQRYDTLSTFGMYNRPETAEKTADHLVTLATSLPRWSYGPLDPVSVYIKITPNPDWVHKAKKVTIQKITIGIEEEITYNPEGDEPSRKVNKIARHVQAVGIRLPEAGYFTNLGLVFPSKDLRNADGVLPRARVHFPQHTVTSFTTTGTLYKIDFFLTVKVRLETRLTRSGADTNRYNSLAPRMSPSGRASSYVRSINRTVKKKWRLLNKQPRMPRSSIPITRCSQHRPLFAPRIAKPSARSGGQWSVDTARWSLNDGRGSILHRR